MIAVSAMVLAAGLQNPAQAYEIAANGRISLVVGFHESDGPMPTDLEQLFYCSVMQTANRYIWEQTNHQHWIGEVTFVWQTGGAENSACPDIHWSRENGRANVTYHPWCSRRIAFLYDEVYEGFVQPPEKLGWIVSHELGHLIYGLDDEYVDYEDDDGVLKGASICVNDEDSTCAMSTRYVGHWCDDTNHLETNPDWPGFSNPVGASYRCWDTAKDVQSDLQHVDGSFLSPSSPPEAVTCNFLEPDDVVNDAVLVLDRSGSMNYTDSHGIAAISMARDAALLFYNKTESGQYSGVVGFNQMVMNPWPIPYGPFNSQVNNLNLTANGNTDICAAIQAATDAIADEGNGGNRNIVLFSDGRSNVGCDPVAAASTAKLQHDITVHTIAFGDADRDELQDIAEAAGGTARSAGNNSTDGLHPSPHELKSDLTRARYGLMGRVQLFEALDILPQTVGGMNPGEMEKTFYVPVGASILDFVWLGNRYNQGPGIQCSFAWLDFELESPSGVIYPSLPADDAVNGEYATARVTNPQAGTWTARIDTSQFSCLTFHELQVYWQAHMECADIFGGVWVETPRAPVNSPVVIRAQMFDGSIATRIGVVGRVEHLGQTWIVPMNDSGAGPDERAGDGTYSGVFNSAGATMAAGAYRVKVDFNAVEGTAIPAIVGVLPDPDNVDPLPAPPAPRTATVRAEAMFRLSSRYSRDPNGRISAGYVIPEFSVLRHGEFYPRLLLTVVNFPLVPGEVRVSLGDGIDITNVDVVYTYPNSVGQIYLDAFVNSNAPCGPREASVQFRERIARSGTIPLMVDDGPGGIPGDADGDGDVDLGDFTALEACMTPPCPGRNCSPPLYAESCCDLADFDDDGDVDLRDLAKVLNGL